jgi:hypothetical protein
MAAHLGATAARVELIGVEKRSQRQGFRVSYVKRGTKMRLLILIILIILILGALPTWPYSSGWGYYPSGGLGTLLIILLILALLGII